MFRLEGRPSCLALPITGWPVCCATANSVVVHVIDVPVDYGENAKLMSQMKMIDCEGIVNS